MRETDIPVEFAGKLNQIIRGIHARPQNNKTIPEIEKKIADELEISVSALQDLRRPRGKMLDFLKLRDLARVLKRMGATREEIVDLFESTNHKPEDVNYIIDGIFPQPLPKQETRTDGGWSRKLGSGLAPGDSKPALPLFLPTVMILPPMHRPFISVKNGREEDVKNIWLKVTNQEVCDVRGAPGFGKTAVVTEVIRRLFPNDTPPALFPQGVIYIDFRKDSSVDNALKRIVRAFVPTMFDGESPPTPEEAAQETLANCKALLVFDSVESVESFDKYSRLLDVKGQCHIIAISRRKQDATTNDPYVIDRVSEDEGVLILRHWGRDRVGDDEIATQLCKVVDYMPLAVELIGVRLFNDAGMSDKKMLQDLRDARLDALDFEQNPEQSIRELFKHFVAQFDEGSRSVLPVIGLLAQAPFEQEVVFAALVQSPKKNDLSKIGRALRRLVYYHWLDHKEEDTYEIHHALMHDYAREMAVSPAVITQLIEYYLSKAQERAELTPEDLVWWDAARPHLLKILSDCRERQEWTMTEQLVLAIDDYLLKQGFWTTRIDILQQGLSAAQILEHPHIQLELLSLLGYAYHCLAQYKEAFVTLEQALAYSHLLDRADTTCTVLGHLGEVYINLGRYDNAIPHLEEALLKAIEVGKRGTQGYLLSNLGNAHRYLGEYQQAMTYYQLALVAARETNDSYYAGVYLHDISNLYAEIGEYELAIDYYKQVLGTARQHGHRHLESTCMITLGGVLAALGQDSEAKALLEQALVITRQFGDRYHELNALINLGNIELHQDRHPIALHYFLQAYRIALKTNDRPSQAQLLNNIGLSFLRLGEHEKALKNLYQSLELSREIGSQYGEVVSLGNLGRVYCMIKEYKMAFDLYQQALVIAQGINNPVMVATTQFYLGRLYQLQGYLFEAIQRYEKALSIFNQVGDLDFRQFTITNLILCCSQLAYERLTIIHFDEADNLYSRVIELTPDTAVSAYVGRGVIAFFQGNQQTARNQFDRALTIVRAQAVEISNDVWFEYFQYKVIALLVLGKLDEALFTLEQALDFRLPNQGCDLTFFKLLAQASHPPLGIDRMLDLINNSG